MITHSNEECCDLTNGYSIIQSKEYFCFTTDSILLMDFCRAKRGSRCVDLGAGQGILSVLLFAKYGVGSVDAIEIQKPLCDLIERNAQLNQLDQLYIHTCDMRKHSLSKGVYDLIICNPPYARNQSGRTSVSASVSIARHEGDCSIFEVVETGMALLRFGGRMVLCIRPSRLTDVIVGARQYGGEVKRMRFVYPYVDSAPNLVLIEIRKGGKPDVLILPPLVMYQAPGVESEELKRIYRGEIYER